MQWLPGHLTAFPQLVENLHSWPRWLWKPARILCIWRPGQARDVDRRGSECTPTRSPPFWAVDSRILSFWFPRFAFVVVVPNTVHFLKKKKLKNKIEKVHIFWQSRNFWGQTSIVWSFWCCFKIRLKLWSHGLNKIERFNLSRETILSTLKNWTKIENWTKIGKKIDYWTWKKWTKIEQKSDKLKIGYKLKIGQNWKLDKIGQKLEKSTKLKIGHNWKNWKLDKNLKNRPNWKWTKIEIRQKLIWTKI